MTFVNEIDNLIMQRTILPWVDPVSLSIVLTHTLGRDGLVWLDGDYGPETRWGTLGIAPVQTVKCNGLPGNSLSQDPFQTLKKLSKHGGHWMGWLAYEAGAWIEPASHWHQPDMATLWAAWHDPILKIDYCNRELWLEGQNPERFARFHASLKIIFNNLDEKTVLRYKKNLSSIPAQDWHWHTNPYVFGYQVKQLLALIADGDLFQANLTACCSVNLIKLIDPLSFYLRLRQCCPSPFGGLVISGTRFENESILSTSMERFLTVNSIGDVETKPIKGTRPRYKNLSADAESAADLISASKDRAENLMIVDLLRNDLGRVCRPGSIRVPKLLALESYERVHHLTSTVVGKIEEGQTLVELLRACWPGGSISGAPKLRAIQRLNELEPVARGPYCGSMFRLMPDGTFDSNLLIRSVMVKGQTLRAHAGCGIVADSDPAAETEELGWKLQPLIKALAGDL
uniref:Putative p-aminobenzoate synthetase n=1 Tax=Paulinella micropora TaxID=1928728 RepID=A0A385I0B9_9EUKA|nr:putative p-aminobenzoate synthetase [Paulinella micropora]AXY63328.1 putative p-aminobenzoate synthetase [Paulinella micropora]